MKTLKTALSAWLIFLITSCATNSWDWEADPYVVDLDKKVIINKNGTSCGVLAPCMTDMICFTSQNIVELEANIEALHIPKEAKQKIKDIFNKVFMDHVIYDEEIDL